MILPQEIVTGGWRNERLLAPVTYLLGALQLRFAKLEEETRLQSMTEMLAFARRPGENIDALLARHEVVRQRAASESHFVMSIEGCALQASWRMLTSLSYFAGASLLLTPQNAVAVHLKGR